MKQSIPSIDLKAARRARARAAKTYETAAVIDRMLADQLLERLEFIRLAPKRILVMGACTGYAMKLMEKHYPNAAVFSLDFSLELLQRSPNNDNRITADYAALPFPNQSFDFIFSNLALPWVTQLDGVLDEVHRVLKPGGLFQFTTLGPDTLKELRQAFLQVDQRIHVHPFIDMHDIGDRLMQHYFLDPVMEVESLVLHYATPIELFEDLRQTGSQNALHQRAKGLMGKLRWERLLSGYETFRLGSGDLPATIEVIYGHAWGGEARGDETVVPIEAIKKREPV